MSIGLTALQRRLLDYISDYIEVTGGISPSLDECADALGLGKSSVHRLRAALIERGHVRCLRNRARSIEIVRKPEQRLFAAPAGGFFLFIPVSDLPEPCSGRTGPGEATTAPRALF